MSIDNRFLLRIISEIADKFNLKVKYKKTWRDYLCAKCRSNNNDDYTKLVSEIIINNLTAQQREVLVELIIDALQRRSGGFRKGTLDLLEPLILYSRSMQIYLLNVVLKYLREELNLYITSN